MNTRIGVALGSLVLLADAARAQEIAVKPLLDARVRYENVDQDGSAREADAVTVRIRSGVQVTRGALSALVEAEGTLGIVDRYNDGLNGRTGYPLVADPQNIELNRAQLRYAFARSGSVTGGRQLIELADQRFVGSASFRQNQQTFDAVRLQSTPLPGFSADVTHAWSVRTINGIDGRGARQQAVSGNNVFALLGHATPIGTATAFAYLVDQDEAAVQGYRLSSQTYGVRLAGSRPLGAGLKLSYAASYARQSDYHRNPNDYAADYYLAEASMAHRLVTGTAGYEVLGADHGLALTSVQTPLGSLFKFQGWADKFTTTPPDGVRDLYGTIAVPLAKGATLSGTYHRFTSDRLVRRYGDEVDLLASAKLADVTLSARYARYDAKRFATDTSKVWLTAEWGL